MDKTNLDKPSSIGIDLGTSNTAICVFYANADAGNQIKIRQSLTPTTTTDELLLPSCIYLPGEAEFPTESFSLPWRSDQETTPCHDGSVMKPIVGRFAREHGALVPDRVVASAKSWLSSMHVQRRSPILPWASEADLAKVSPVEASTLILEHCRDVLTWQNLIDNSCDQRIVVTVPASFDEVARSLTIEAASKAGMSNIVLLEEPQAALYAWLQEHQHDWRDHIKAGSLILVCDVGGGTTDFSLVSVTEQDGGLALERVSVGEHILLGGDNIDLALAYMVSAQLEDQGTTLDHWQFLSLIHACRNSKERLLMSHEADYKVAVASRTSSLFKSTISSVVTREMVMQVLEGFFPLQDISVTPLTNRQSGIQEHGLSFAEDPSVTSHLSKFLQLSAEALTSNHAFKRFLSSHLMSHGNLSFVRPDAVLFNGGIFNSEVMRQRIVSCIQNWIPGAELHILTGSSGDTAVARGAAYYGSEVLSGRGIRIKAATSRSYYLGIETSMPAVPGFKPPLKALCVVPMGMEEGSSSEIEAKRFDLVTGRPVSFRFFGSSNRREDVAGAILPRIGEDLFEAGKIETVIPRRGDSKDSGFCPVHVESVLTETGVLELWLKAVLPEQPDVDPNHISDNRWKLEFNVRE